MPVTKSPHVIEPGIEQQQPSYGGRGPHDKLPTGGGGDDEQWGERPEGRRGPRERLTKYRIGVFLGLSAIGMFFVALASTYFFRQGSGHIDSLTGDWIRDWRPIVPPRILWLNTAIILGASAALELARRAVFHPTDTVEEWLGLGYRTGRRTIPALLLGLLCGLGFLFGQYRAWLELKAQGAYYGVSAHFFAIFTAAHAAHLLLGIAALLLTLFAVLRHARLENRQILIDSTAWYWHGMAIIWIGLFAVIWWAR